MCTVELDTVKPCHLAPLGANNEVLNELLDLCRRERPAPSLLVLRGTDWRLTDKSEWGANSSVVQLDNADATMLLYA